MIEKIMELKREINRRGFVYEADTVYMNNKTYNELRDKYIATTYYIGGIFNRPPMICGLEIRINSNLKDYEFVVEDNTNNIATRGTADILTINRDRAFTFGVDWFKSENNKLPKKYIINKGATVLFWDDDSKTVVKRHKEDAYDIAKGFLWAYFLKTSGMSRTKANKYLANIVEETIKNNMEG